MSKQEFLEGLRRSVSGGLDPQEVNEHIRYYSDYIDSQIRGGVTEEEVMRSLGEPRLIAKTLLGMEGGETVTEEYVDGEAEANSGERYFNIKGRTIRVPGWLFTIFVCVICFCILTVIFALMTKLLPFFFMFMLGVFLYRMIRNLFG